MIDMSQINYLALETLQYVVVLALLTVYLVYIWRNTKLTVLLQRYFVMHFLAILVLLTSYAVNIAPTESIKWFCAGAANVLQACFILSSISFTYHLLKGRSLSILHFSFIALVFSALAFQLLFVRNIPYSPVDVRPLFTLLVFSFFFYGVNRLGWFSILSKGVIESLEMLNDAVLVYDNKGVVLYANKACRNLDDETLGPINTVCREVIEEIPRSEAEVFKKSIGLPESGKALWVLLRPIRSIFKRTVGYVCIIHDDTDIVALIHALEDKNRQLEEMNTNIKQLLADIERMTVQKERNMLAKEIHDVLGHSLNYALHVLESNRIIVDKDPERAIERLRQAVIHIDRGLGEIRADFLNETNPNTSLDSFVPFSQELKRMVQKYKDIGLGAEIAALDDLSGYSEQLFRTLYRICQEAITNAVKHGAANQVIISIKKAGDSAVLRIVDDGAGCAAVIKGGGLSGMEARVRELGGVILFSGFEDGRGFQIQASIPLVKHVKSVFEAQQHVGRLAALSEHDRSLI